MLTEVNNPTVSLAILWTLFGIATAIVAARLYCRITQVHLVRRDDYLMLTALIIELISMILITVSMSHGVGKHFVELSDHEKQWLLRLIIGALQLSCILPSMFGRLSFATLLLYIIGRQDKIKRWILWSIIAVQIIVHIIVIVQLYSQCGTKINALWNFSVRAHAHCQSPEVQAIIGYVQSALNSLCDITLSIVPAFILYKLQMRPQQKFGLACVLMLSVFAFIASVIKALQTRLIAETNDVSWYSVTLQFWVTVENDVVIITGSIPTITKLFRRKKSGSTSQRTTRRNTADTTTTQQTQKSNADTMYSEKHHRMDSASTQATDAPLRPQETMPIRKTTTLDCTSEERMDVEAGMEGDAAWLQDLYCSKPFEEPR